MTDEIYIRKYILTVGRSTKLLKNIVIPSSIIRPGFSESIPSPQGYSKNLPDGTYVDFLVSPGGALTFSDLRVEADIEYTKAGKSNKQGAKIKLHNVSEKNRSQMKAGDTVLFRAGYDKDGDLPPLIFTGQIKKISHERVHPGILTTLVCTEAEIPRKNIEISKVPKKNENSRDIANYFAQIAANNGIPTGNVFVPIAIPYPSGFPAAGNLFLIMEEFCERNNLRCYVSLGRLYIEPIDSLQVVGKVDITEDVVKGSIESEDDTSGISSSDPSNTSGIKMRLYLNGNITLATIINVTFGDYKGEYQIESIKHSLDLEKNNWDTELSCKKRVNR